MELKKKKVVAIPIVATKDTSKMWEIFSDQLRGFIAKRVVEHADVEDILQEVFLKIHLKKHSLKNSSKLVSWIYQLTRNAITDFYRKKAKEKNELFLEVQEADNQVIIELSACVLPFIDRLPEKEKELVNLVHLKGASQKELAKKMNIPYPTLKSKLQRSRKKIKEMFLDCCAVELDKNGRVVDFNCDDC